MAAVDGDVVLKVTLNADDAIKVANELQDDVENIITASKDNNVLKPFSDQLKEVLKRSENVKTQLTSMTERLQAIQGQMNTMRSNAGPNPQYEALQQQLNETTVKLGSARDKAEQFRREMAALSQTKVTSLEFKTLESELSTVETHFNILNDSMENFLKRGGSKESPLFKSMQKDADILSQQIDDILQKVVDFPADKVEIAGTDSEEYKELAENLQDQEEFIQHYEQDIADFSQTLQDMRRLGLDKADVTKTDEYRQLASEFNEVKTNAKAMTSTLDRVNGEMLQLSTSANQTNYAAERSARILHNLAIVGRAVSGTFNLLTRSVNWTLGLFKKFVNTTSQVVSNLAKMASSGIIGGIKRLGSAIANLNKHGNKNNDVFKKAFRMLLRYGLGVRSFYFLFRKLRKALTEGIGELSKAYEPLNSSMSNIKTALMDLRNSFAAAFAPIIQYVEPILTKFIMMISEAVTKVGMLIAALTGKQYAKLATTYQDYAKSLDKSTKSSSKNKKATEEQEEAAKELQRTLAGFDDVEILHEDKDKNNKSSTPDTDTDEEIPTLANIPVDDSINDFVKRLLDAWKNADFYEFGRILGEKIRDALNSIPWDAIKEGARKVAKSIATFLNGFLETPGLFDAIGKTLAEALNTAFEFLLQFAKSFHFDALGEAVGTTIKSALDNIDWPIIYDTFKYWGWGLAEALNRFLETPGLFSSLGTTLANAINAIFTGLYNFIITYNAGSIGGAIATFLNNALGNIDWPLIQATLSTLGEKLATEIKTFIEQANWEGPGGVGETIGNLFNTAVGFVFKFAEKDPFNGLGEKVAGALNTAMATAKSGWILLKQTIRRLFISALKELYNFSETFDFEGLGDEVSNTIKQALSDDELWEQACKTLYSWFHNIVKFLRRALPSEAQWKKLGERIAQLLDAVPWGEVLELCLNALKDAFFGFFQGLGSTVAGKIVLGLIMFHVTTTMIIPFVNSIVTAFGGPTVGAALAGAIGSAVNGGAAQAAAGLSANSSGFLALAGKFSAILAGLFIGFKLTNGDVSAMDNWQDVNTLIADTSKALDALGQQGTITSEQMQTVYSTLGQVQTQGLTTQESVMVLAEAFAQTGISGDALRTISKELGLGLSEVAVITDTMSFSYDTLKSKLADVAEASGFTDAQFAELSAEIDRNKEAGLSSQEWYNLIITKLTDMGVSTDDATAIIKKCFPQINTEFQNTSKAATEMHDTVSKSAVETTDMTVTGVTDSTDALNDALSEINKESNKNLEDINSSVTTNISDAKDTAIKDTKTMNTDMTKQYSSLSGSGNKEFGNLNSNVKSKLEDIKRDANTKTSELANQLHQRYTTIGNTLPNHFKNIGRDIGTHFEAVPGNVLSAMNLPSIVMTFRDAMNGMVNVSINTASQIRSTFSSGDWPSVGRNICQGIYDGIRWGWDWLTGTARALAENMLSEAKWALGIASPSKEFMWVAKMITAGLAEGIENTEDTALDSVNDLAKSIVDEAETANPVLDFGISFEDVLTNFSDSVSTEFENLITKLEAMADNFAVTLPSVVSGRVVPYQSSVSQNREQSFIDELLNELDYINMHQLTADDIESVMERTVRGYVESIGFYIGDEDLARHVNKGNVKLSRRFNV